MKEIRVASKKYGEKIICVDDEDYAYLNGFTWMVRKAKNNFYATRMDYKVKKTGRPVQMHRVILGVEDSAVHIDHIDHNGLNNQKSNLRTATRSDNASNIRAHKDSTSGYLGVSFDASRNKWALRIYKNGKVLIAKRFDTEIGAAKAYDALAKEIHGQFANLNFPEVA